MVSKKFVENSPLDMRVDVDYKTGNVYFDYPEGGGQSIKAEVGVIFPFILSLYIMLHVCFFIPVFLVMFAIHALSIASTTPITEDVLMNAGRELLVGVAILFYLVGIPLIISVIVVRNYGRFSEIIPKMNFMVAKLFRHYYKYTVDKLDSNVFEIPLFHNVILNYVLKGDFARYIESVRIVEHPFKKIVGRKEKVNINLWKGIFTFTEIPKEGEMEVCFI